MTAIPTEIYLKELQKKTSSSGSIILGALVDKTVNAKLPNWSITHYSHRPESGSFQSLDYIICNDDESLIIVGGELILSDKKTEKSYPPGYIIQNWKDWKDQSKRKNLNLNKDGVDILKLPRSDLQDIITEDPNFAAALIQVMYHVHPKQKFSDTERELIRSVRDEVLQALSTRDAFSIISGRNGIVSILNPGQIDLNRSKIRIHPKESEVEGEFPCSAIEQAWKIVNPISMLLLGDRGVKGVLEKKAREIRAEAEKDIPNGEEREIAEKAFKDFRLYLRRKRISAVNNISQSFNEFCEHFDLSQEKRLLLSKRVFQIFWLASEAKHPAQDILKSTEQSLDQAFSKYLILDQSKSQNALKDIKEDLDSIIEPLFNLLQQEKIPGLRGARVRKLDRVLTVEDPGLIELPSDHWVYKNLFDLNKRLVAGDKSVVGGTDYQMRRWPQSLHPYVLNGTLKVVFCDGALGDGIRWIRRRFGSVPGTETYQALTFKILKGEYGDFPQCFITFENGEKFWLISFDGGGIGRPFSNAMAIRLHAEKKDVSSIIQQFIFLEQPTPVKDRLSDALTEVLLHSDQDIRTNGLLGEATLNSEVLPTQLAILHHLNGLLETAGSNTYLQRYPSKNLHEVAILFWKNEEGQIIRNILVPVGGRGLYHASAGVMIEAFLSHPKIPNPIRHVYFSAQAGLISNTDKLCNEAGVKGVGDEDPGGLIVPQNSIVSVSGNSRTIHQIPTLLTDQYLSSGDPYAEALRKFIDSNEIYLTSNHIGVSCPADETENDLAEKVREYKVSSVDVECFFCVEAANNCGAKVTIANIASDVISTDRKTDKYHTFAFSGALQSGAEPDPVQAQMAYLVLRAIQHEELKKR